MIESEISQKEDWNVHDDPEMEVKGFRIGDLVRWGGVGHRFKIVALCQLKRDESRWYALVRDQELGEGGLRNLGLDYLRKCDVVEQLGARVDDGD